MTVLRVVASTETPKPVWFATKAFITQGAHTMVGALFMIVPLALTNNLRWPTLGSGLCVAYGLVKECIIDPWKEGEYFWKNGKNGAIDLAFILLGNILAWMLYLDTQGFSWGRHLPW